MENIHFNENAETIDAYVQRIRQIITMLNYGKPQICEVFKNTLPSHLYRVLFSIDILRQAVETANRILNREKLDRQLAGQGTGASPFLTLKGERQHKTVIFNKEMH